MNVVVPVRQRKGLSQMVHMVKSIARNQLIGIGVGAALRKVLGRKVRGGSAWAERDLVSGTAHILDLYDVIAGQLPSDLTGTIGLEIGPGESTALAACLSMQGAQMYAVEKYASIDEEYTNKLAECLRPKIHGTHTPNVTVKTILVEEFWPDFKLDFVCSVDVMEHVRSPFEVFEHCFSISKPGGKMVHSIDLAGHQIGDVDHLCCPDWLWSLAFSHVETTNRVRLHEFVKAAEDAGFSNVQVEVLRSWDMSPIKHRILPRWKHLPADNLGALQILLTATKPAA